MTIGLVLDPYGEKSPGGLGRAVFEMCKALVAESPEDTFRIFVRKMPAASPAIPGRNWTLRALGEGSIFLRGARNLERGLDCYVFFTPLIPLFFFPRKSVVVVHDFAYLELPDLTLAERLSGYFLYIAHAFSLRKASKIVAISHAAKESTLRHFRVPPQKVSVAYNGFVGFDGASEPIETPEKFFLFAGVLKKRKNVHGVIAAFARFVRSHPEHCLLIAGKKEGEYYQRMQALVRELQVEDAVRFLGYVTDGQLSRLYEKAEALVFPSFVEGFGMPVIEAMHKGLPVVTSDEGALAEVAGDAALLVDPHDPDDIARGLARIADEPALREALKAKGRVRATQFDWATQARHFRGVIASL